MKKSDLIKVIREIVRQEVKKELPNALAQVFAQIMGQAQRPEVHSMNTVRYLQPAKPVYAGTPLPHEPSKEEIPSEVPEEVDEMTSLKAQLSEMFNGGAPVKKIQQHTVPQPKQFTKNPVLNEILNQTRGFSSSERMAMRAGGGGGVAMSPAVAMAASGYSGGAIVSETGVGQMMDENELGFMRGVPTMPGADSPVVAQLPVQQVPIPVSDTAIPAAALGQVSALDIKNHPDLPDSIKGVLNRDYRSLVKTFNRDRNK